MEGRARGARDHVRPPGRDDAADARVIRLIRAVDVLDIKTRMDSATERSVSPWKMLRVLRRWREAAVRL